MSGGRRLAAAVVVLALAASTGFGVAQWGTGADRDRETPASLSVTMPASATIPAPSEVLAISLSFGGPARFEVPLPLDPVRAGDRATIDKMVDWLDAAEEISSSSELARPSTFMRLHMKDSTLGVSDAWNCTRTANSTSCLPVADEVIVYAGDAPPMHLRAPELAAWLHTEWQRDSVIGSHDAFNAALKLALSR